MTSSARRFRASYSLTVDAYLVTLVDQNQAKSITNDAQQVIADLAARDLLRGRRVVYCDTMGRWDELVHDGHRFVTFAPFTRA